MGKRHRKCQHGFRPNYCVECTPNDPFAGDVKCGTFTGFVATGPRRSPVDIWREKATAAEEERDLAHENALLADYRRQEIEDEYRKLNGEKMRERGMMPQPLRDGPPVTAVAKALAYRQMHLELKVAKRERDAMQSRAEAAEGDWRSILEDLGGCRGEGGGETGSLDVNGNPITVPCKGCLACRPKETAVAIRSKIERYENALNSILNMSESVGGAKAMRDVALSALRSSPHGGEGGAS